MGASFLLRSDSAALCHVMSKHSTILGGFKKGRNRFVLTHAKFLLFKEFIVHIEQRKVTPGPPLQLKIPSVTYN